MSPPATSSDRLFPAFLDLRDRRVAIVGGGAVARRKVEALSGTGARIRVIAPRLDAALASLAASGAVEHVGAAFRPDHLDDAWFAIAATDDDTVNRAVAEAGAARRVFVNVVDDATACSAQLPARVERGALQVAISSGGHAPMLARHLRERLERELDASWSALSSLLADCREAIRRRFPDTRARRAFFDRLFASDVPARLRAGDPDGARAALDALLAERPGRPRGRVALVGAGPGDPGLLTLRALRLLNEADVILHDRLVDARALDLARRDATFVDVGKTAGGDHVPQAATHALMLEHARAGRTVVRLKGGDPFVFGRGGEEMAFLRAHGVDVEVVPGITAALACGAYAGIPLTHRDHAQSVRMVTAHSRDDADRLDWAALAAPAQTVAFYMGVSALERVQAQLLRHGAPASRPFALVENGSRPDQRVVTGTLARLADIARAVDVRSPALLIVGEVATLAQTLHWYGAPPIAESAPGTAPVAHAA